MYGCSYLCIVYQLIIFFYAFIASDDRSGNYRGTVQHCLQLSVKEIFLDSVLHNRRPDIHHGVVLWTIFEEDAPDEEQVSREHPAGTVLQGLRHGSP